MAERRWPKWLDGFDKRRRGAYRGGTPGSDTQGGGFKRFFDERRVGRTWFMRRSRRFLVLLSSVAAVVALTGFLSPGVAAAAPTPVINCFLNLDYPHASSHVPGTVNVVANVTCTAPVSQITLDVQLIRDGNYIEPAGSCLNEGSGYLQCNAAEVCHSGSFYSAQANAEVIFPPGYAASPQQSTYTVPEQQIFCTELDENETLTPGEALHSPDGEYSLQMQSSDGISFEHGPTEPSGHHVRTTGPLGCDHAGRR